MAYSQFLTPRQEVITDRGVEGIIDLANIKDETGEHLEARPADFLDLTYPTSDVIKVLEEIHRRFADPGHSSGLFLFEGLKGSGKSHLLLLIHNLFAHKETAREWLARSGLTCDVPDDVTVILNKFTDDPHAAIWNMILERLGAPPYSGPTHPKIDVFKKALGDRRVVLIFDELEQGINVIREPAVQAQNIAFLQALSEYGNRSPQVTLFASVYTDKVEPGSTFKRILPRCTVQFDNDKDKSRVILHRLFENHQGFDPAIAGAAMESYLQNWQRHARGIDIEELRQNLMDNYPFSPSLMKIILRRIPARGGFQNVRGAIAFLSNLVRLTYQNSDLITPAAVALEDRVNTIILKDLDPGGDLISRAKENMDSLRDRLPLVTEMTGAVLLYTLSETGSLRGASREELIMDLLTPSTDINDFETALAGLQRYASHFWHQEGRYYFDTEENPEAKVEFRSLNYSDEDAEKRLKAIVLDIFKESMNTEVYASLEQIQSFLKESDKSRTRYILAGRRLTQEERHKIYFGAENRNLILLLEPSDDRFHLSTDKDLVKWAKRILAATDLIESTTQAQRKEAYRRIFDKDMGYAVDRIKKAGLVYIRWETYGQNVIDDQVELEALPSDWFKDKVLEKLNQDCFPMLTFKEHMERRLEDIKGSHVRDIESEYRMTLGFPVPLTAGVVPKAIRTLCKDGQIGIQHSSGNYCWENPQLTESELSQAKITDPFEKPGEPKCPRCGMWPCQCPPIPPTPVCPICGQSPCVCGGDPGPLCPKCGKYPCVCPTKESKSLKIPAQMSAADLRQQAAFRLQEFPGALVTKITHKVFFEKAKVGDLSTLTPAIRGGLTGPGDIVAEISITKSGSFTKSQVEQQIEALPTFQDAMYSLELIIEVENP